MAQINLSGSVGVPGSASILGGYNVVIANTTHTMTPAEFSNKFLNVNSSVALTGTQNLIAPLNIGQEYVIQNNTTGGHAIQIIGTSGIGVTIANGATVSVICDSANYLIPNAGAVALGGDLSGTTSSATVASAQNGDIVFSPNTIDFASTVISPVINQTSTSTGAGQTLTLQAQGSTSSLANGGNLVLASGTSATGSVGSVSLAYGNTNGLTVKPSGTVVISNLGTGVVHADSFGNITSSAIFDQDIANSAAINVDKLGPGTAAQLLLNNSTPVPAWTTLTGDVTLTSAGLSTVTALQGNPVLSQVLGASQDGYVLTWKNNADAWEATAITNGSVTLNGDVTGPATSNTVTHIQNFAVANTTPTPVGQYNPVLIWNPNLNRYDVRILTADDIAPGFSITSFGTAQTVEVGFPIVHPTLTASYSATPASATLTNSDGFNSPFTMSSPFTSSGSAYASTTFQHNTVNTTTTFTLSATSTTGVTKTQSFNYTWEARMFIGHGPAGSAASATATAGNTATLGNGTVLNNQGLLSSATNQVFPVSPSGDKVYLLITGLYTNFFDTIANQPFSFLPGQAVSFTNQNSQTVSMYLYESTNTLTASFNIKPIS